MNKSQADQAIQNFIFCPNCDTSKPTSEFYKHRRMRTGYDSACKECRKHGVLVSDLPPLYKRTEKLCRKCNQTKHLDEFSLGSLGYPNSWCKSCIAAHSRQTTVLRNNLVLTRSKLLSTEEYRTKFLNQLGKCFICHQKQKDLLCVDHNHNTNEIRHLLCDTCNLTVGKVENNIQLYRDIFNYLGLDL